MYMEEKGKLFERIGRKAWGLRFRRTRNTLNYDRLVTNFFNEILGYSMVSGIVYLWLKHRGFLIKEG